MGVDEGLAFRELRRRCLKRFAESAKPKVIVMRAIAALCFAVLALAGCSKGNQENKATQEGQTADVETIPTTENKGAESAKPTGKKPESIKPGTVKTFAGIEFVWVPPGTADLGSTVTPRLTPIHSVTLAKGFWLGKYEVTQGQWKEVMGKMPTQWEEHNSNQFVEKENRLSDDPALPVGYVSHANCQEFLVTINTKHLGVGFMLPTADEWEYACRAGSTTEYCFGNDSKQLDDYCWYEPNSNNKPHPVGQKKPNAWGLHDMHGNILEWTDTTETTLDPNGVGRPEHRAYVSGGSYNEVAESCRSGKRSNQLQSYSELRYGLRLAKPQ